MPHRETVRRLTGHEQWAIVGGYYAVLQCGSHHCGGNPTPTTSLCPTALCKTAFCDAKVVGLV